MQVNIVSASFPYLRHKMFPLLRELVSSVKLEDRLLASLGYRLRTCCFGAAKSLKRVCLQHLEFDHS